MPGTCSAAIHAPDMWRRIGQRFCFLKVVVRAHGLQAAPSKPRFKVDWKLEIVGFGQQGRQLRPAGTAGNVEAKCGMWFIC